ncbi:uncharacterized protein isoform X2 [Leptinotarsa decemlineata]|uniref:uncharacterized protein isoform X2 n=1 Tax=Leptinotarsa decemlineata TaxID=7539 RepID=UPI003D30AC56
MSRPQNMLRTRRKDCNVKPNRRLDRKSSRGMIYENEELRLKTININAEVESRQSDIKKLKKENEMLKKGLWYLRDEYDKLEKLIKDKKIDFSSSSTTCSTSSDSESCRSFSEGSEEVEAAQNLKNVQRTNLKNMQVQFDHLSVVTEETSADNSELNSNRTSLIRENWTSCEDNILQPDQSYPDFGAPIKTQTIPEQTPLHFFSPIKQSKSFDDNHFYQMQDVLYPGDFYDNQFRGSTGNMVDSNFEDGNTNSENFVSQKIVRTQANCFYQNMVLVPKTTNPLIEVESMEKSATDLIVKIDNQKFNEPGCGFNGTPSRSTFSNGGNLEELLNDIESISQEILRISNLQKGINTQIEINQLDGYDLCQQEVHQVEKNPIGFENLEQADKSDTTEKPFKSELNVVLMPNPMPLIGIDKYKNIQRSMESLSSKPIEELSVSQQNLCLIPPPKRAVDHNIIPNSAPVMGMTDIDTNPFFFGNLRDNYVNADYFGVRYNPDNFFSKESLQKENEGKMGPTSGSKTNLLDLTSSEHVSSENEGTIRLNPNKSKKTDEKLQQTTEQSKDDMKSPKMSIRKKVSIHFKGKKGQNKNLLYGSEPIIPKTPPERKMSIFERFNDKDKNKSTNPKTPTLETRKSVVESNAEPKTTSSSESKSSSEKRNSIATEKKDKGLEKKIGKSRSVSPDRKHVQVKDEGIQKRHRKHKKLEKGKLRRSNIILAEPRSFRERSFSVCTDRSNTLGLGIGLGFGSMYFEEYSDRERTNSVSSCETAENTRKMSTIPNAPLSGKLPWCGCWGNGCL